MKQGKMGFRLILALLLAALMLPMGAFAEETCTCNVHCTAELILETSCAYCKASGNPDDCQGTDTLEGGDFTYNGIVYHITDKYNHDVSVKDGKSVTGNVTIPSKAFNGDVSYTVTKIDYEAFMGNTKLKTVTIPDSVEKIYVDAFADCTSLTSVTIPNSVTLIEKRVFKNCTSLSGITLPNGITDIHGSAFSNCTSLTSIAIPNGVTSIGISAFQGCRSLSSITLPGSVTSIENGAFRDCASLTSIAIPNGVTGIRSSTFEGCTGLTSIAIPDSVTSIGVSAFKNCTSLTGITIPGSVISIEGSTFWGCTSLTSIAIPNGVTCVGDSAFRGCSSLSGITIPSSVTSIENGAFRDCTSLTGITIPDSVTSIGRSVFEGCDGLTSITIPDSVTSIADNAFKSCNSLTGITIPDSVTSIGVSAFEGCDGLTSITVPASVTTIEENAFRYCSSLESVIMLTDKAKTVHENAFQDASPTITYKYATPRNLRWDDKILLWDPLGTGYVRYKVDAKQLESPSGIVNKSETYYVTGGSCDLGRYLSSGTYEIRLTAVEPEILDNSQPSYESSDTVTLELKYPHQVEISNLQVTRVDRATAKIRFTASMAGTMYTRFSELAFNRPPAVSTEGEGTPVPQGEFEFTQTLSQSLHPGMDQYLYVTFKTAAGVVSDVREITIPGMEGSFCLVTASAGEHGSISPASEYVQKGGDLTFTITPEEGYALANLTVGGEDVTEEVSGNQYTLSNVQSALAVEAVFREAHTHCVCGGDVTAGDHTAHEAVEFAWWGKADALPQKSGHYVLASDVTLSGDVWQFSGVDISICLNGHTIRQSTKEKGVMDVMADAVLNICDCAGGGSIRGMLENGKSITKSGLYAEGTGMIHFFGGTVADGGNAGVMTRSGGTIKMYGGEISGNTRNNPGGGVSLQGGAFHLYGGSIICNDATRGGGVAVEKGAAFHMLGGTISQNRCTTYGGGVYVANGGSFEMQGGTITGNITKMNSGSYGGGVFLEVGGDVTLSGKPVITGNTSRGAANNLHLQYDVSQATVTVGELTQGANIGVSMYEYGVFSQGGADSFRYFTSDSPDHAVAVDGENLKIVAKADCDHSASTSLPSCEEGALCSACGVTIPSLGGHKWDTGVTTQEPSYSAPGVTTFTCAVCGETRKEAIPQLVSPIRFTQVSVSLAGDIGLNYYAEVSEALAADASLFVRFTFDDQVQDVPMSAALKQEDGTYRFSCKLAAKDMACAVTGQAYTAQGAVGEGKTYSVREYCTKAIEAYGSYASQTKLVDLLKAMLNYGARSQISLNHNIHDLANLDLSAENLVLPNPGDLSAYAASAVGSEAGIKVVSASLLLKTTTTIRVYFQLTGDKSIDRYAFTANGKAVTPVKFGDQYYVDLVGIEARNLDTMYTITCGGITVKYCGLSYVKGTLDSIYSLQDARNTARALYGYAMAANEYFGN